MNDASKNTVELIRMFLSATAHVEEVRKEFEKADADLSQVKNALGEFLVPQDANSGDFFSIWVRHPELDIDVLLCIKVPLYKERDYEIWWRK